MGNPCSNGNQGAERSRTAVCPLSGDSAANPAERGRTYGPDWKNRRDTVLAARGPTCEKCGETGDPPVVHHVTYERFGNERDEDLLVLCGNCHQALHEEERAQRAGRELRSVRRALRILRLRSKAADYERAAERSDPVTAGQMRVVAIVLYEVASVFEEERDAA